MKAWYKKMIYPVLLGCAVLWGGYTMVWGDMGIMQYRQHRDELAVATCHLETFRAHVDQLEKQVSLIKTDDFYIEKTAREDLGLARKREVIYVV